jgi:hypothetical protein
LLYTSECVLGSQYLSYSTSFFYLLREGVISSVKLRQMADGVMKQDPLSRSFSASVGIAAFGD